MMMKKRIPFILVAVSVLVLAVIIISVCLYPQKPKAAEPKVANKYSTYTDGHSLTKDYTEEDYENATQLIKAIETRNIILIDSLLRSGMEVNCPGDVLPYESLETPLNVALDLGCNKVAYKLLKSGATAKYVIDTESPLCRVASSYEKGDLEMTEFLLTNGSDPNEYWFPPIVIVAGMEIPKNRKRKEASKEVLAMFKRLEAAGANINAKRWDERGTLICAVWADNLPLVKYLVEEKKIDINQRDWKNETALMAAACVGNPDIVKCLVKHGANKEIFRNDNGESALDLAIKYSNNQEVIDLLSEQ